MLPSDLKAEQFAGYPPQAQEAGRGQPGTACNSFRSAFCPACCGKSSTTISSFPQSARCYRSGTRQPQLSFAGADQRIGFSAFSQLPSLRSFESFDWINQPAQFVEQLNPPIFGPPTSSMRSARQRQPTANRTRIVAPSESTPLPMRLWASRSSDKALQSYDRTPLSQSAQARHLFQTSQAGQRS